MKSAFSPAIAIPFLRRFHHRLHVSGDGRIKGRRMKHVRKIKQQHLERKNRSFRARLLLESRDSLCALLHSMIRRLRRPRPGVLAGRRVLTRTTQDSLSLRTARCVCIKQFCFLLFVKSH